MIKRIALSHESNPHLVEELVQEIYLAIWKALPTFRGEASLRTFVARIATNRSVTHLAKNLNIPPSVELDEQIPAFSAGPESQAIANDRKAALVFAIRSLPLPYREAAMLALEGMTPREISDVLGITTNAVSIRLSRAKDLLRKYLGENL
ncbi:MAG: sigma-70 family RNA polymerase sigma factor [Bryobacterales bacterium]|nr:sigma-70 family RNA polymerase sigma factor [Bryobacterales bacterium]MBV9397507.1 sigma-70 family RNA polymerase sigma factor [Bryobacterales bacterium]